MVAWMDSPRTTNGIQAPSFLYGTAWKEDDTQRLVTMALAAGFRGIDTANQRKHYHEAAVGEALQLAFDAGMQRDALFIQTKFTHRDGQDHRLPYDEAAPISTQVLQSFESSLAHLQVDVIDSYVLHGPSTSRGLAREDREAWAAMEELHAEGRVRMLGVSNVTAEQLSLLCREARTPPAMVQNRTYARKAWDREVRAVAKEHGVVYQGFSLLTASPAALTSAEVDRIVARTGRTRAQIVYRFAMHLGMICLCGTKSATHMAEALAATELDLTADEIKSLTDLGSA